MRNTGDNLTVGTMFQAYYETVLHAIPHPTSLRSATLPPGEGSFLHSFVVPIIPNIFYFVNMRMILILKIFLDKIPLLGIK